MKSFGGVFDDFPHEIIKLSRIENKHRKANIFVFIIASPLYKISGFQNTPTETNHIFILLNYQKTKN